MPFGRPGADTPFGFAPYAGSQRIGYYRKNATVAAIYQGDLVTLQNDGNVHVASAATTLHTILGVAAKTSAASTADTAFPVYDDPDQQFYVQDDGDTTHMAETQIGNLVDIIATTGSTTTDRSQQEIDSSSAVTGAPAAFTAIKVLGLHPMETSGFATTTAQQRKWIVMVAPGHHVYATSSGV